MGYLSPDRKSSCGLLNAVFGRRRFWPRRSASTGSTGNANNPNRSPSATPKRRRSGSDEVVFLENQQTPITSAPILPKIPPMQKQQQQHQQQKPAKVSPNQNQGGVQNFVYVNQGKRVPKEAIGISGELESMISDHQKSKGSSTLVRASSSNVMLAGQLGNLRQPGGGGVNSYNILDHLPKTREEVTPPNGKYPNSVMGNVVKKQNEDNKPSAAQQQPVSLCRALSTRMDPEQLKIMGNEDYKNGNFAEALALYDAAISIDPNKASYRSNKSAALTALGRLLEAVFECREAIWIEPRYFRAHHRLATLYLRLGDLDKATSHYKHAGPEADPDHISKVKAVQSHLDKCTEARRCRDWNTLLKEARGAISSGADSAVQIYALQAEALIRLQRHQEADETFAKSPKFESDDCTRFFGPIGNANVLVVKAQVDLAMGRFEDALDAAQRATRLDPNSKEASNVVRRARAVGAARSNGNQLFKAAKFSEATMAYGEGLEHDPYNSVLLYNRAACRSKLSLFEKAIEDCNTAINLRPSYSKARLRRADCYAKLGKLEASIQDYEVLQKESPDDEEVGRALSEVNMQLQRQKGGAQLGSGKGPIQWQANKK